MWPAGEHFDYSNLGYAALGEALAHARGRELGVVLREEVFEPLGMTRSSLGTNPAWAAEAAVQYNLSPSGSPQPASNRASPSGGSSVFGSAHDVALFGMFHLKAHARNQPQILTDAAIDTMQSSTVDAGGGSRYGIGWSVEDRFGYRSLLAQGGTDAATAWLRLIPSERIGVTVLADRGVGQNQVIDAVLAGLLPAYRAARDAQMARANAAVPQGSAPPVRLDPSLVGTWRGRVVTADALLTQREVSEQIVAAGGDYLFPVDGNQAALLTDATAALSPLDAGRPSA